MRKNKEGVVVGSGSQASVLYKIKLLTDKYNMSGGGGLGWTCRGLWV